MRIIISGDAGDAIRAIAACQAAIDSLRGKVVTVQVSP